MPAKKTNKSKKNDSVKLNVTLAVLAALALTFILLAILWEPFEAENMTTYSTGLVGTYLHFRSVSDNVASTVSVLMFVIVSVAAYMLGSMNFAIMTSKALYNEDIRNYGSKNAGMTNMFRVYGKKAGFYTRSRPRRRFSSADCSAAKTSRISRRFSACSVTSPP